MAVFLLKTSTTPLFHPNFGDVLLGLDWRCWGSEKRRRITANIDVFNKYRQQLAIGIYVQFGGR